MCQSLTPVSASRKSCPFLVVITSTEISFWGFLAPGIIHQTTSQAKTWFHCAPSPSLHSDQLSIKQFAQRKYDCYDLNVMWIFAFSGCIKLSQNWAFEWLSADSVGGLMKGCGKGIRRGWLSSQISASHNILLQPFDIVDSVLSSF